MKEYVPSVGHQFTITWKQHHDRSYINTVWRCLSVDGDTVIGMSEIGDHGMRRKIVFRSFDVAFQRKFFPKDYGLSLVDLYDQLHTAQQALARALA